MVNFYLCVCIYWVNIVLTFLINFTNHVNNNGNNRPMEVNAQQESHTEVPLCAIKFMF